MDLDLAGRLAPFQAVAEALEIPCQRRDAERARPARQVPDEAEMRSDLIAASAERLQVAGGKHDTKAEIGGEARGNLRCLDSRLAEHVVAVKQPRAGGIVRARLGCIEGRYVLAHRELPALAKEKWLIESQRQLLLLRTDVRRGGIVLEVIPGLGLRFGGVRGRYPRW